MAKKNTKRAAMPRGLGVVEVTKHKDKIHEYLKARYTIKMIYQMLKKDENIQQTYNNFYRNVKKYILDENGVREEKKEAKTRAPGEHDPGGSSFQQLIGKK